MMNILPVIVLYNCRLEDSSTYKTLLNNSCWDCFVVYDNSPESFLESDNKKDDGDKNDGQRHVDYMCRDIYIRDTSNGGLAKAYNIALRIANEKNNHWLLLLDQDTLFPESAIDAYNICEATDFMAPIARTEKGDLLSPCKHGFGGSVVAVDSLDGSRCYPLHDYWPINSGTCINVHRALLCGGFDERLKLDYIDHTFACRYSSMFPNATLMLLPMTIKQHYSNDIYSNATSGDNENVLDRIKERYVVFLQDSKTSQASLYTVLKHALSLTLRTKKKIFIVELFKIYF